MNDDDLTLPGSIPGLLRRGSPVTARGWHVGDRVELPVANKTNNPEVLP